MGEIQRQRQGPTQGDLDLNSASQSQLETLPNVDRETARRIINNRPYRSMQDLTRAGLSQRTIDGLYNVAHVSNREYGTPGSDRRYERYQGQGRGSIRVRLIPTTSSTTWKDRPGSATRGGRST